MTLLALGGKAPPKCLRADEFGNLPTCTRYDGGTWVISYPDAGTGSGADVGGFVVLFVLAAIAALGFTIWRVSTARRMARDAGMDEGDATAMTLLTDDGFEATYLASNLRDRPATTPPPPVRAATSARLAELQGLRDQGLVTEEEYAAARQKILDEL